MSGALPYDQASDWGAILLCWRWMPGVVKWERDELILALDLYFEMDYPRNSGGEDARIAALARLLSELPSLDGDAHGNALGVTWR